jgi:hypothetical protein
MYNLLIELNLPIENFYYSHSNDYFLLDSFKISREMCYKHRLAYTTVQQQTITFLRH